MFLFPAAPSLSYLTFSRWLFSFSLASPLAKMKGTVSQKKDFACLRLPLLL